MSITTQAQQQIAAKSSASRAVDMAKLKKLLQELEPADYNEKILAEDTKFGIIDPFFLEKTKVDKNGNSTGLKTIQLSFDSLKDLIENIQKKPSIIEKKVVIAYQPVSDNYHYILVRKFNIDKNNLDKYLLLI